MSNTTNKTYYDIRIHYQTGDSFNSYKETENLGIVVSSIELAKYNLSLIKRRYYLYQNNLVKTTEDNYQLKFKTDNDGVRKMPPFWEGYFERLISAKIVIYEDEDEDLEFIPHNI